MKVGTEQEWQAARKELLAAERELEEHSDRVERQRRELPWVAVEREYRFATESGSRRRRIRLSMPSASSAP